MRTCYFCCMRACVCMCMTFEMAESDSEAAVSYVCHPFSHSRVICPMLLHPHIVHLCVHTHVHTCSRHPPERDCTDVCSYHLRVCSCSSKKFLHYHLSFLMTSWCFLELSCQELQARDPYIPWGALSWDWTHRPLGVTVALLSIVERGLLRWGNWISKESCFSAQVEGCLFVCDVLHFETHTSPPLPL